MATKASKWPRIRPRKNKEGIVTSYQLDLGKDPKIGNRTRISYKTLTEAETAAAQYRTERQNFGTGAGILSPGDLYDASKAILAGRPYGITLQEAMSFAIAHRQEALRSLPVVEVVEAYLATKMRDNITRQYKNCLSSLLGRFAQSFERRLISDLHGQEIIDWLAELGVSNLTQNDYRVHIGGLIKFAKLRNYLRTNPLTGFPWAKVNRNRPVYLSVHELQALLECADATLVPILALGAFAGLRPIAEALKLEWQDIDWTRFEIRITKSKNEISHRVIDFKSFAAPLLAWVGPYAQSSGRLYPYESTTAYHRKLERARHFATLRLEEIGLEASCLRNWTSDCVRHSFATFHSTHFGDGTRTADLLGHGFSSKMLRVHYRGLVSPSETPRYWSLTPQKQLPAPGQDPYRGIQGPRERVASARLRHRRATDPEYRARVNAVSRNHHRGEAYNARRRERYKTRRAAVRASTR